MRFRDRLLLKHGKSYRFPYGSAVLPPWNSFRRKDSETITQSLNSINEFFRESKRIRIQDSGFRIQDSGSRNSGTGSRLSR